MKKRRKPLLQRLKSWCRRHSRAGEVTDVVFLTRPVRCFGGALEFLLTPDFRLRSAGRDTLFFTGRNFTLTVMRFPFRTPLQHVRAHDLWIVFRPLATHSIPPEVSHGFLRYSPTLTAKWAPLYLTGNAGQQDVLRDGTLLYLVQVRDTVYLLMMRDIPDGYMETAQAIADAVRVHPEEAQRDRMQNSKECEGL